MLRLYRCHDLRFRVLLVLRSDPEGGVTLYLRTPDGRSVVTHWGRAQTSGERIVRGRRPFSLAELQRFQRCWTALGNWS